MPVLVLEELKPPSLLQLLEPESQRGTRPCFLCPLNRHLDLPSQRYLLILPPQRVLEIPASSRHCHLSSQTRAREISRLRSCRWPPGRCETQSQLPPRCSIRPGRSRPCHPLSSSSSCLRSPAKLLPLQGLCTSRPGVLSWGWGGLRSLWCASLLRVDPVPAPGQPSGHLLKGAPPPLPSQTFPFFQSTRPLHLLFCLSSCLSPILSVNPTETELCCSAPEPSTEPGTEPRSSASGRQSLPGGGVSSTQGLPLRFWILCSDNVSAR